MITIHIEGAAVDEVERGLLAAQAVFDRAGVTAYQAAEAHFDREGWDLRDFADPVPDGLEIAELWDEADTAAVAACCASWPPEKVPSTAELAVVYKPDAADAADEDDDDADTWADGKMPEWLKEAIANGEVPADLKGAVAGGTKSA